ncbi:MAG TPA: dihydrofolate reductase [Gammaproteobacteria bacterium]|nr:dihydrofolate reductase [Gammaproteobacteria bacterium]
MNCKIILAILLTLVLSGCGSDPVPVQPPVQPPDEQSRGAPAEAGAAIEDEFAVETERFADLRILRYRVPGFDELSLREKQLLYYLSEAGYAGREIIYDQKYRYNLAIKRTLEKILRDYPGQRDTPDFQALVVYLKRIWFSNGIHHHYATDKFDPGFGFDAFTRLVHDTPGEFPIRPGQSVDEFLAELRPVMFDPAVDAKLVNRAPGIDPVTGSAVNFYSSVTRDEVEAFYAAMRDPDDPTPVEYGLNSRLVKIDGEIREQVWRVGGLYSEALEQVVEWLERARSVAQSEAQRSVIEKLIAYYRSGSLEDWDEYNVAWVENSASTVDAINGFIEVYNDPIGYRGSFESVVQIVDPEATRRIDALAREAQWFEDNSPIADAHKKPNVTGITGRVINVVSEAGDASPATPVGINLPNSDWIRRDHGSKSVSLANISAAYDAVGGAEEEFAWDAEEIARGESFGEVAGHLQTDMHEVIGHASGQLNAGVGPVNETLGVYGSTLEEARADLVGLYFMLDPKLVELGLLPNVEAGHIAYDRYIRNGLMQQLNRIEPGNDIEQDHMRNRQMVAAWALERGREDNVIDRRVRDGKTFFVVQDYAALREIFGRLLRELQRIKSEGDHDAIRDLVENYGVSVDAELHAEVRQRYAALDIPAYSGFINPRLVPVVSDGEIVDVNIEYPDDFTEQMLDYAQRYAHLPTWNF